VPSERVKREQAVQLAITRFEMAVYKKDMFYNTGWTNYTQEQVETEYKEARTALFQLAIEGA
jgi:hypothetical protein